MYIVADQLPSPSADMPNLTSSPASRALSASALGCLLSMPGVSATQSNFIWPSDRQAQFHYVLCVEMAESLTNTAGEFSEEQMLAARNEVEFLSQASAASFFAFERSLEG